MTKQRVMALGFFDGIHVGHAALIDMIKQRARETGAQPAVLTFDVHPDNLVFNKTVPLINSAEDRVNILKRCFGVDEVVVVHFSRRSSAYRFVSCCFLLLQVPFFFTQPAIFLSIGHW